MTIKAITEENRGTVSQFFQHHWGSAQMIVSTGTYNCDELDGFICEEDGTIIGLVTYVTREHEIEVISLDSIKEGRGMGAKLMDAVELVAKKNRIYEISLITTNDNLHALKFYQKRGYRIVKIIQDAVTKARKIKSSIPLVGNDNIPLHDEIQLMKRLSK
jgi:ribosomal protein S18 acetylase RimI-like enzyme